MASSTSGSSFKFNASNVVYIKNLSPLVTEADVREVLRSGGIPTDEILKVAFKQFAGSTQRYCQVDFKTSGGVTTATSLNGQPLLGLPMNISVIDALGPAKTLSPGLTSDISATAVQQPHDLLTNGTSSAAAQQTTLLNLALQNHIANAQAVQLASLQARQLAEQKRNQLAAAAGGMLGASLGAAGNPTGLVPPGAAMGGVTAMLPGASTAAPSAIQPSAMTPDAIQQLANLVSAGGRLDDKGKGLFGTTPEVVMDYSHETEEQQVARTVHVSNIPITYNDQDVKKLFTKLGTVTNMRLDFSPEAKIYDDNYTNRFALVEFVTTVQAQDAVKRRTLHASSRILEYQRTRMLRLFPLCCILFPHAHRKITPSKITVGLREPDGVRYDLASLPTVPVAYQQVHRMKVEEKMAKVRSLESSLAKKLQKRARAMSVC